MHELGDVPASVVCLSATDNRFTGIGPVKSSKISVLYLCRNPLESLAGLAKFRFLKELSLQNCNIEHADEIREVTSLTTLYLSDNRLKTLDFCSGLKHLMVLDASRNCLQSPSPDTFSSLTNIQELRLGEFVCCLKFPLRLAFLTTFCV